MSILYSILMLAFTLLAGGICMHNLDIFEKRKSVWSKCLSLILNYLLLANMALLMFYPFIWKDIKSSTLATVIGLSLVSALFIFIKWKWKTNSLLFTSLFFLFRNSSWNL
ncbi:hypothetical protein MFLO_01900 [Listeria floridensis FSL S10-1187]|uniref:Uncharacterized protein n=1 Tax=Listeria floridensis FSL S10-1187 TaxID=1265817 RepID=A0ABP3B3P8_9LIST|nr:hypothetical protein MFLO_01900 [Listeria floridensis FSL S10-1187]